MVTDCGGCCTPQRARRCAQFVVGCALVLVGAAVAWRLAGRRLVRYEVTGSSMLPALLPGDWLICRRRKPDEPPPAPGSLVISEHPSRPGIEMVKRVASVGDDGRVFLAGDNREASTDSLELGPVPAASVTAEAVLRYWPPRRVALLGRGPG